jgi:hypothetical protein
MDGIKCNTMIIPINCVPEIKGAKNPHTGQVARRNTRLERTATRPMAGRTLGQYTLHAEESLNPLNRGK